MLDITIPEELKHLKDMRVSHWYLEEGDEVEVGVDLVEVTSEEGAYVIQSPCCGVIEEVYIDVAEEIMVNDVLGTISSTENEF